MHERIPITPDVLIWARKRSGYTVEELSRTYPLYKHWEDGTKGPTYTQLEKIAEKFKCPLAVFFFPKPPNIEPIEKSFRTLPEVEFEHMPRSVLMLIRKARAMQLNLVELNEGKNPSEKFIIKSMSKYMDTPLSNIAKIVRSNLSVSLEQQISWKNIDEALEKWRNVLINHGVYVFKDAFKADEYSGFCLYDKEFPIIVINNSNTKNKQIFTLFHELMHLLFNTSGIDKTKDEYINILDSYEKRIEIFCNKFTGEFLVPESDFNRSINDLDINEKNVSKLASRYKVSREVILRKFLDKKMVSQSYYLEKSIEWANQAKEKREERKAKKSSGNYYNNQITYLGYPYINLVLSKYHQNKIDRTQLSEYLGIKPKNISKFEDKYDSIANTGSDG